MSEPDVAEPPSRAPASPGSRRTGSVVVTVVALVLLAGWFVGPPAGRSAAIERRPNTERPELTVEALGEVDTYEQIEAWLRDHLRVKPVAAGAVGRAVLATTGRSTTNQVIAGGAYTDPVSGRRSGPQLFYFDDVVRRCAEVDALEASAWATVQELAALADRKGVAFHVIFVPDKGTTLEDSLPWPVDAYAACRRRDRAALLRIEERAAGAVSVIRPEDVLAIAPEQPYWEGDSHWTPRAGIALTEQVLRSLLGGAAPTRDEVLGRLEEGAPLEAGDLYNLMGWVEVTAAPQWGPTAATAATLTPLDEPGWLLGDLRWQAPAPLAGTPSRTLVVHDSFVAVPRLQSQIASFLPSGDFVHWDNILRVPQLVPGADAPYDAIVMETVERIGLLRFRDLAANPAMVTVRDYLTGLPDRAGA